MAGWVLRAQNAILEAAEVVLDWLWFTVASSSASFASVNPLLLQYNTGTAAYIRPAFELVRMSSCRKH